MNRSMKKCFVNGQPIRHKIKSTGDIWVGRYDIARMGITRGENVYYSPSAFAVAHNKVVLTHRVAQTANGWSECECQIDGNWVSIFNLPEIVLSNAPDIGESVSVLSNAPDICTNPFDDDELWEAAVRAAWASPDASEVPIPDEYQWFDRTLVWSADV